MTPSQKAIEAKAEELYPIPSEMNFIPKEAQLIRRKIFVKGATFGLSLQTKWEKILKAKTLTIKDLQQQLSAKDAEIAELKRIIKGFHLPPSDNDTGYTK